MDKRELAEEKRWRCVFVAHYKIINDKARTLHDLREYKIDINPDGFAVQDVRENYQNPVIKRVSERRLQVRVYDENAVDLERSDLLGDCRNAVDRCEQQLEKEGWTINF